MGITQDSLGNLWGKTGNYIYMLEARKKPFPKKLESKVVDLEAQVREKLYPTEVRTNLLPNNESSSNWEWRAPVVEWTRAGLKTVGTLVNVVEHVPTDCPDADCYALIIDRDSMMPKMEHGDRIIIAPNSRAQNGDVVIAQLRDANEVFLNLFHEVRGSVRLTSYNIAHPMLEYPRTEFLFIQPVYSLVRKLRIIRPK